MYKIFLFLFLFLFVGCGMTTIQNGKVVNKYLVPAHEEDDPDITISVDPLIIVPGGTTDVPDKWYIVIEKEVDGSILTSNPIWVTKELHDSLNIGDWFELSK